MEEKATALVFLEKVPSSKEMTYEDNGNEPLNSSDGVLSSDGSDDGPNDVSCNDVVTIFSGLYGVLLVIIGLVLPITETFVHTESEQNYLFESFYIYIYSCSITFLVFFYLFVLRKYPPSCPTWICSIIKSRRSKSPRWKLETDVMTKDPAERICYHGECHQTGSFFLRLGAIGFGMGSMILDTLYFGQYFGFGDAHSFCRDYTQIVKPSIKFLFSFFQLFFLFRNSKACVLHHPYVARFGFMHMSATNICVWCRVIVVETLHSIHSHQKFRHLADHNLSEHAEYNLSAVDWSNSEETEMPYFPALPELSCQWSNLIGQLLRSASPYLYAFTIEYSVICAGILYVMWENVGLKSKAVKESNDVSHKHRIIIDCAGSSRGLFLGILTFVASVVVIIIFIAFIDREDDSLAAVLIVHLCEIVLYSLTIIATICAGIRMRHLKFSKHSTDSLEKILALISFCGVLMFSVFSISAGVYFIHTLEGFLTIVTNIFAMTQATLQLVLLIAGMKMSAGSTFHATRKNGREFVTFLLMCNITMWGSTTFEIQKGAHNPVQLQFYGPLAWGIFTHLSVPLAIFFRFHSTVCLSHIWKHAWKLKQH